MENRIRIVALKRVLKGQSFEKSKVIPVDTSNILYSWEALFKQTDSLNNTVNKLK